MKLDDFHNKEIHVVIGLMSGSSCDGIDAALVRIKGSGLKQKVQLGKFETFPYPSSLRTRLLTPHLNQQEICMLNFELGGRLADAAETMIEEARNTGSEVDLIASHGHTVAHVPPRQDRTGSTLQIGEPAVIAERSGIWVVSDFRARDVAAGGHGAPLVPYADWLLFARESRTVVCLNIGGIANFTVVTPQLDDVSAFDSGPGNMIIDGAMRYLSRGAKEMDENGATAAKGKPIDEFLEYLLDHPFFQKAPPKSTGREEFGVEVYLRDALNSRKDHSQEDLMATVTAAAAESIVQAFNRFIKPHHTAERIIVSGGGVANRALMARLRKGLHGHHLRTTDQYGIPADAKEAIAFAILGNETIAGKPANVCRATGAAHPAILGKITPA